MSIDWIARPARLVTGFLALLVALPAAGEVKVAEPWARATMPGQKVAGAYMKLTADADARLVAASSPAARVVEVHEMAMVQNVMKMRPVPELALPAGRTVELRPGGYHLMLIDIVKPLAVGDKLPIKLSIVGRDGKTTALEVTAEVRSLAMGPMPGAQGKH